MKSKGWGRIVNIASAHALVASPFKSAYVAAKHGIAGLTKTVALEAGGAWHHRQCDLPRLRADAAGREADPRAGQGARHSARKRSCATCCWRRSRPSGSSTVEEVAALAAFLCSDDAALDHRHAVAGRRRLDRPLEEGVAMRKEDILELPSMPAAGPSYPAGPYRFINREYMVITYETDPEIDPRSSCPSRSNRSISRSSTTSGSRCPTARASAAIPSPAWSFPAAFGGEEMNFVSQMYLDDDPPIAAGREIWGFPEEIRPSQARDRQGHADRHARICRPARGHGHHGLQAREHGRQRRAHDRDAGQDAGQPQAHSRRRRSRRRSASSSPTT